ncbi:hypothetical protein AVEN_22697-1 [Araneus ventricosus]|uniref:RNase H type-1 domain-containing protein n=1 Tax=Araneus ventricosus TaxID=182803 RepID=A0A4Y2B3R6_ARAVE|nr:hypothetical protein AVEN_22697-1 [Araneus ventricosus]
MVVLGCLCAFSMEKFSIKLYVKNWNPRTLSSRPNVRLWVRQWIGLLKIKKKINIYTDSRSSIEALKSYGCRSKFVISIKNKFCLAEGLVGLSWVKAHVGIPGNELADHFAKLASVEGEGMDIPFPYSFVKFTLKKKLLEDWQIYYGAYETASGNRIRGFVSRLVQKL